MSCRVSTYATVPPDNRDVHDRVRRRARQTAAAAPARLRMGRMPVERRSFLIGGAAGLALGGAGATIAARQQMGAADTSAPKAPAIISGRPVGTTWKVQTSWPAGVGLSAFRAWCN